MTHLDDKNAVLRVAFQSRAIGERRDIFVEPALWPPRAWLHGDGVLADRAQAGTLHRMLQNKRATPQTLEPRRSLIPAGQDYHLETMHD